jgi:hypothetical protein
VSEATARGSPASQRGIAGAASARTTVEVSAGGGASGIATVVGGTGRGALRHAARTSERTIGWGRRTGGVLSDTGGGGKFPAGGDGFPPDQPVSSASTFAACPAAFTLGYAFTTVPAPSMTKVLLSTPSTFLPYMVFSPQAP